MTEHDDDPAVAWYRRKMLEDLSKNTRQPVLAEMAREILAGRLTTRQAMCSNAYMEALGAVAGPALAKYTTKSESELAAAEREGRAAVNQLMAEEELREATERQARSRRPHRAPVPEDDEPTGSIMVRASDQRHRQPNNTGQTPWASGESLPRSVRNRAGRRG